MNDMSGKPQIGKDVIESLTLGMYEDCRFIYREYIQNAADAIDKAVSERLMEKSHNQIMVSIDTEKRRIVIEDNGTGISRKNVANILLNIAHSTKQRGVDKGFRGIGRLGGLGYCSTLVFETSYFGEAEKSIMIWDAELLKNIINDRDTHQEAVDVLQEVTNIQYEAESIESHYFKVTLEDVSTDELLDVEYIRDYLSMVAPVDIESKFLFRSKINRYMKEHGLSLDIYNIYINGDQIFKPYTSCIYEDNKGGKKKTDEIRDIEFLIRKDEQSDELIYWGWYTISALRGQMKSKNLARGIRLRKENIQIGDEEICKKFFAKTEDQRFSFYFFGEIHAVSKGLIPNSRRDYFGESDTLKKFERLIREDFCKLKDLCYDASKYRNAQNTIAKTEEIRQEIQKKEEEGYTSTTEKETLQKKLEEHQKKDLEARKQLERIQKKMEESNSPLLQHLSQLTDTPVVKESKPTTDTDTQPSTKTKYRTDGPKYSSYDKKAKKLISRIYESIKNYLPEGMSEPLIQKIEEDLTR
jgi:hypothetical protein